MRKERSYSLLFGRPLILPEDYFIAPLGRGNSPFVSLETFFDETANNAYLIDKHNISFRITKTEKATNVAEITVDNLSDATVNYLLDNRANNLVVIFKAGYDGNNKLLFQGTMKDCIISKTSDTLKTKIILEDGKINTKRAHSSRVYPAGTPVQRIADDLILDLAVPRGRIVDLPNTAVTFAPYSIVGNTFESLKGLMAGYGYIPNIDNGICYIIPDDKRLSTEVAWISPTTGLIGNVQGLIIDTKAAKATDDALTRKKRIRFTCQIDATLAPQSSVYVTDEDVDVNGAFKIEKVEFMSSGFESGNWIAIVDAAEIEATVVA